MAICGYAGKILRVDLSALSTNEVSTLDYADRFVGGRGIAAKIYWDEVAPEVRALDADNRLVFATGPLAGLPVIGGSRWQVCGKSCAAVVEQFSYANLGGRWGAELKFAGYDGIVVHGKSENPVYLFLHGGTTELKDASDLWGKGAIETRKILRDKLGGSVKVLAIGPAGENMVTIASLLAENDASGSGGLGAVMGSKRLKAVVVEGTRKGVKVAQPGRLQELTRYFREIGRGWGKAWGTRGSGHLITGPNTRKDPCYGCISKCPRVVYEAENGEKGKFMCHSALFYRPWAERYYGGPSDVPFHASKLCNEYGLDVNDIDVIMCWLNRCHRAGIITDESIGIPISRLGSLEFVETLVKKVSLRDGYGDVLAQGVVKAADWVGHEARRQLTDHLSAKDGHGVGEGDYYGPRLYITTAILHAMEPRPPIQQLHEACVPVGKWLNWVEGIEGAYVSSDVLRAIGKRFWGSETTADFSTCEGKALAAKRIQDRQYAKECLILCDFLWPIVVTKRSQDYVGDPSLESKILSAVTGREVDEDALYRIGERVFNLQRAILVREGHRAREDDRLPDNWHTIPLEKDNTNPECLVPGRDGKIISRKGAVVHREEFEKMKDEYYGLRRWDVATGFQTKATLEELGLRDVADDLEKRRLVSPRLVVSSDPA
jgi:aldehyde:ferredoxin oxidoreductase